MTFGLPSTPVHQVPQPCLRLVFISQVTTEPELLTQSAELQEALGSGNLLNYCQNKIHQASLQSEKMLWQFLKVGSLKAGCSEVSPQSQIISASVNNHPMAQITEALTLLGFFLYSTHPGNKICILPEAQRLFVARETEAYK